MNKDKLQVWYYDSKCRLLKIWRRMQRLIKSPHQQPKFLFILCAPYCGSTLLHEIISTSAKVSPNNIFGTREGQSLPEFRQLIDYRKRWERSYKYPWKEIKKVWWQYWDISKPILLDKSPANLIRVAAIAQTFPEAHFIAMPRNPYAHCESLMRRDKMDAREAAVFALDCLQAHQRNQEGKEPICFIKYEDLTEQPEKIKSVLTAFLPEISDIELDKSFSAHNYKNQALKLTNLNREKIDRLTDEQLSNINIQFQKQEKLLKNMGYSLIVR